MNFDYIKHFMKKPKRKPNYVESLKSDDIIALHIANYKGDKLKLYEFIMRNKEYATKQDLILLLDAMGKPSKLKNTQLIKMETLRLLDAVIKFETFRLQSEDAEKEIPTRPIIKQWYEKLKPSNNYEIRLKNANFEDAYKDIHQDLKKYFPN